MEANTNKFLGELSDLRKLISFYNSEVKLLADFDFTVLSPQSELVKELSNLLNAFPISKRVFNYNSIIISLYGSFERYIENILISYVDNVNRVIDEYTRLPKAIVTNHFHLSITLLSKIEQSRYSGRLKKEDIIRNLHTCINTSENFQLNKDVFAQHEANFRSTVIDTVFSKVGIPSISDLVLKESGFNSYIKLYLELGSDDQLRIDESFPLLNDLAERRNDVAHGVPGEIIRNEILLDYIEHLEYYATALKNVLIGELLKIEVDYKGKELGEVTDLFQDGQVVCVYTNMIPIKVGDVIVGRNALNIVKGKIVNLKLDDKEILVVDDKGNYEVGIEIDTNFKKNFKIFVMPN